MPRSPLWPASAQIAPGARRKRTHLPRACVPSLPTCRHSEDGRFRWWTGSRQVRLLRRAPGTHPFATQRGLSAAGVSEALHFRQSRRRPACSTIIASAVVWPEAALLRLWHLEVLSSSLVGRLDTGNPGQDSPVSVHMSIADREQRGRGVKARERSRAAANAGAAHGLGSK